jgi:hypothetical protein
MLRFLWNATRGYRLHPWASPYLKWRIETYAGIPAEAITREIFFHFVWSERRSLWTYLKWVGQMAKQNGRSDR